MSEKRVREYKMAFPEMPEAFKAGFIEHAGKVVDAKDKKSKIDALVTLMLDLNAYTRFHKISSDEIKHARGIKADERGLFVKGIILVMGHGKKLVRDRIPELYPEDIYPQNKYRRALGKELQGFFDFKVLEETLELMKSIPSKRLEEVADLTEVIFADMNINTIIPAEVLSIVQSKEDQTNFDQRKQRRQLASKSK